MADKDSQEQPFSIFLVSTETSEKRRVTTPPVGFEGDSLPSFSPDGKTLAFIRSSSQATADLYLTQLTGGEPRRLTFDNTSLVGLAWTSDGRDIVATQLLVSGNQVNVLWKGPSRYSKLNLIALPAHVP